MKKILFFVAILSLILASCEFGSTVTDHSGTVEGPFTGTVYDRDYTGGGSGFVFFDDGGTDTTMNGTADVIDFYYDDVNLSLNIVSPDGDTINYPLGTSTERKETRFAEVTLTEESDILYSEAPSIMSDAKITIEEDGWYYIKLDNDNGQDVERTTEYVLMHVIKINDPDTDGTGSVEFEFYCQTDGTRYFGNEE